MDKLPPIKLSEEEGEHSPVKHPNSDLNISAPAKTEEMNSPIEYNVMFGKVPDSSHLEADVPLKRELFRKDENSRNKEELSGFETSEDVLKQEVLFKKPMKRKGKKNKRKMNKEEKNIYIQDNLEREIKKQTIHYKVMKRVAPQIDDRFDPDKHMGNLEIKLDDIDVDMGNFDNKTVDHDEQEILNTQMIRTRKPVTNKEIKVSIGKLKKLKELNAQVEKEVSYKLKFKKLQKDQNVQLLILIDLTGSMFHILQKVKDTLLEAVDKVSMRFQNFEIEIGLIGYRDFDYKEQFVITDPAFTTPQKLKLFIEQKVMNAEFGEDTAEDVFGGLEKASSFPFDQDHPTRILIHFADAPCHGKEFWPEGRFISDFYPKGDPNNRNLNQMMRKLAKKRVHYYFFSVPDFSGQIITDKMTSIFKEIYEKKKYNMEFKVLNYKDEHCLRMFIDCIDESVTKSREFLKSDDSHMKFIKNRIDKQINEKIGMVVV